MSSLSYWDQHFVSRAAHSFVSRILYGGIMILPKLHLLGMGVCGAGCVGGWTGGVSGVHNFPPFASGFSQNLHALFGNID